MLHFFKGASQYSFTVAACTCKRHWLQRRPLQLKAGALWGLAAARWAVDALLECPRENRLHLADVDVLDGGHVAVDELLCSDARRRADAHEHVLNARGRVGDGRRRERHRDEKVRARAALGHHDGVRDVVPVRAVGQRRPEIALKRDLKLAAANGHGVLAGHVLAVAVAGGGGRGVAKCAKAEPVTTLTRSQSIDVLTHLIQ